jgi:hypothetical protein
MSGASDRYPEKNRTRKGPFMQTVVLACHTIHDELEKAARETNCHYPFIWVESGLHLRTEVLRRRLQEELDKIEGVDRVLFGFGFCGNSVVGLTPRDYELIFPKVDDCITLLLGSHECRKRYTEQGGVYFLTKGWLEGELNIWKEYQSVLERYGPERTERIFSIMLAHYRALGLIDTGAYDLVGLVPHVEKIAATLNLEPRILPGTIDRLKSFLSGPWNEEDYVIIPPFTTIEISHVCTGLPAPMLQGVT